MIICNPVFLRWVYLKLFQGKYFIPYQLILTYLYKAASYGSFSPPPL